MKNRSVRSCFRAVAAVGVSLAFSSLFAETVTVGSVADLVLALNRLNPDKSKSHTVILKSGRYNVSGAAEMLNTMFVDNRTKDGSAARDYYPESKGNTNVVARNCIFGVGERYALPRVMENCAMDKVVRFLPAADDGYPFQPKRQKGVTGAGLVQDWMASATDIRGEGFPRLRDGKVDIGCYQNWLPIPGMMMTVW